MAGYFRPVGQVFFNGQHFQDQAGNLFNQAHTGHLFYIGHISQHYFPPTTYSSYSAPLQMRGSVSTQQHVPAAVPQTPPAPAVVSSVQQQSRPPQDIMIRFEHAGLYCTFFGVVDHQYNSLQPPSETNPLNGKGTLRYFLDAGLKTELVAKRQEDTEFKNFVPLDINKAEEECMDAVVENEFLSQLAIALDQRDAEEREEKQRTINVCAQNFLEQIIDEVILAQVDATANEDLSETIIDQAENDILELLLGDLSFQALKEESEKQSIKNPTYAKDGRTITRGTIDIDELAIGETPAEFTGPLARIKGEDKYKPGQGEGVVSWGRERKFEGHFNGQGIPTAATKFILGNGCQYHGSVNSSCQLHGDGVLTKIGDANWQLEGNFTQDKLIGNATVTLDKKGTQYIGPVDDQYRLHGTGKMTKIWNGITLVFDGQFVEGQWQSGKIQVGKLGVFEGELSEAGFPTKGKLTFLSGGLKDIQVDVEFDEQGIVSVKNLVIDKTKSGGPTLTYSGRINSQTGYPEGDGVLNVVWGEGSEDNCTILGEFTGQDNIINKQGRYEINYTESARQSYAGGLKNFKPEVKKAVEVKEVKAKPVELSTQIASQPAVTQKTASTAPSKNAVEPIAAERQILDDDDEEDVDGLFSVGVSYLVGDVERGQENKETVLCWYDESVARIDSLASYVAAHRLDDLLQQHVNVASQKMGRTVVVSKPQQLQILQWKFIGSYVRLTGPEQFTIDDIAGKLVRWVGFTPTTKVTALPILGRIRQIGTAAQPQLEFCLPGLEELPAEVMDIRKKVLTHLGLDPSLALPDFPMRRGHTVNMFDEEKCIGECFFRCVDGKYNHEDYYFLGKCEHFGEGYGWLPSGMGILVSASGDVSIGLFGAPCADQVQPNLEQGFVLWRMASLIVVREKSPNLSWQTGLVSVEIYDNQKLLLETVDWSARWQLNHMADLVVESVCGSPFIMPPISSEHWGEVPRFSGCIQQVTIAADCLNAGVQPKQLQGKKEDQSYTALLNLLSSMRFSQEASIKVLVPGMAAEVKSVAVHKDKWTYEGSMNRGRAVVGKLNRPKCKKTFNGAFDLNTGEPEFKGGKSNKENTLFKQGYVEGEAVAATFFAV